MTRKANMSSFILTCKIIFFIIINRHNEFISSYFYLVLIKKMPIHKKCISMTRLCIIIIICSIIHSNNEIIIVGSQFLSLAIIQFFYRNKAHIFKVRSIRIFFSYVNCLYSCLLFIDMYLNPLHYNHSFLSQSIHSCTFLDSFKLIESSISACKAI